MDSVSTMDSISTERGEIPVTKRALRLLASLGLAMALMSFIGASTAFAAPRPHPIPSIQECTVVQWHTGVERTWTNNLQPTNWNQKLDVRLMYAVDSSGQYPNTFCDEYQTWVILQYRYVGSGGTLIGVALDDINGGASYDSVPIPANTSGTIKSSALATGTVYTPCAHGDGEWFMPNVIDVSLRVPASGYYCGP